MNRPCFVRRMLFVLALCGLATVGAGCADGFAGLRDPSFDLWCGGALCTWETDEGRVERVGTWNRNDFGVSFASTPTQISQRHEQAPLACYLVETVADVTASARVSIQVDFGDDGEPEFEQLVAEARWAKLRFELPPPKEPNLPVRFILRKEGRGRAVLAHLQVSSSRDCDDLRARLDGASCTGDSVCASGRCSDGHCVSCTTLGCADGITCSEDRECLSRQCLVGRCQSCGLEGTCPAFSGCTMDSHCASGRCGSVLAPSRFDGKVASLLIGGSRQCAQCRQDADCESGICHLGACADCRSDADCQGGEQCRYADEFDATERSCLPPLPAPRARGGLCEGDQGCDGLRCGALGDQPRRCGRACSGVVEQCSADRSETCFPSGVVNWVDLLTLDSNDVQARVSTCLRREDLNFTDAGAPAR